MADADGLEAAIRRVLPALNFEPQSLPELTSFVARARRRSRPSLLALDGVENILVFIGTVEAAPEDFAKEAGARGLSALTDAARTVCRRIVVAWEDPAGRGAASAFALDKSGDPGRQLGASWLPPASWATPMVDAAMAPAQRIDTALAGVRALIVATPRPADFGDRLRRAVDLLDTAIRTFGGEGQHLIPMRGAIDETADWDTWLDHLERSVREEQRRVTGGSSAKRVGARQGGSGPLADLRVFLSYARPDATTLAWPVNRALHELGAQVWFDQEEPLEKSWLDEGLATRIAECDGFVMCASDEYVERAGYATQELAWALSLPANGRRLRRFALAARPGTILPSLVASWPLVVVGGQEPGPLTERLAAALAVDAGAPPALPAPRALSRPPPLPSDADLDASRRRRRHVERFLEVSPDDALAFAAGKTDDRRAAETRRRLMALGEGLDWDGTLGGLENWPEDPLVRGCRWDLACLRVLAALRWPLSGDREKPDGIAPDLARILTRPTPILDAPSACGWANNERRLFLRRQAGLLRSLGEMLTQGLDGGLSAEDIDKPTIAAWTLSVADRRREIADALIDMRLAGTLSWQGDPPTWDALYRHVARFLEARDLAWDGEVPGEALMILHANREDIAAVSADVAWTVSARGETARQSFTARNWPRPLAIEIWAAPAPGQAPEPLAADGARLAFGLGPGPDGALAIALGWRGIPGATGGAAWAAAPERLRQELSLSSA